ncbi:MAG: MarR family transcriptional regulator [Sedimentisphaerales bacterium]|nr:MarR family transcriptional regulator [Sedimentisphaerales bacterium]
MTEQASKAKHIDKTERVDKKMRVNKVGYVDTADCKKTSRDYFFETYGMRILTALRRIIRAVDIHSHKLNHDFNITAPQMICLYGLVESGEMTQSELARQVHMGISTINGVIDRLEKKGLVIRQRDTKDRRKVFVRFTDAGRELTKAAPALLQERFSESLLELEELEQAAIALSLERVVQLMEVEHLEASPNLVLSTQVDGIQEQ